MRHEKYLLDEYISTHRIVISVNYYERVRYEMKKNIIIVFGIIGAILLCLIVWAFFFGNGVSTIYEGVAGVINSVWHLIAGQSADDIVPPTWNEDDANLDDAQGTVGAL